MKKIKPDPNEWRMKEEQRSDRCWWWLASLFMAAMLAVIAVACQEEAVQPRAEEEGLPATIQLEVLPDAATQAQTRVDENAIKDLHVLVYNNRGELIGQNYGTLPKLTVNTRSGSDCRIYAIANTNTPTLFNGTVASTEAKLKAMKTAALSGWDGLTTAANLVMIGSKTEVTITAGKSTLPGGMTVARIAAKVTLNIAAKSGSGITIKDYQVFSLPKQSYYVPNTSDGSTSLVNGVLTTVNAASANKTFFMYENRKGIVSSLTAQKDKGADKAPANATYIVINGEHKFYKATWRVYLGENNSSDFNMKRNSQYTYNITLSRPGTDGADTRVDVEEVYPTVVGGNSNCYMVSPHSAITIPVERANESFLQIGGTRMADNKCIQLEANTAWTASLVWESSKGLIILSETTGIGPAGRFKVTATNASTQGNAVVAIKNASNQILWSWHIWVTTYDGSTRFANNNGKRVFTFMDQALGASSAAAGQSTSCGLIYQWGRKDPFPGIGQSGGSWNVSDNTDPIVVYNASGILNPITKSPVSSTATPNNLTNATRNPDTFYYNVNVPYDWFVYNSSSAQNNDLWSGGIISATTAAKKSVFDPCPVGWRIPPWLNNTSPFANMNSGWSWSNNGQNWTGTGGYFPASGCRHFSYGTLYDVSTLGCYWSGSPSNKNGYSLNYRSGGVAPEANSYLAYGYLVRCCLDNL